MIINRSIDKDGNYLPKAYNLLSVIPDSIIQSDHYKLAHPKVIYLKSIRRVYQAIRQVINAYDACIARAHILINNSEPDNKYIRSLKSDLAYRITEMFHAIAAHIDDCYHIMKSLYPYPTKSSKTKFADQWLENMQHSTVALFKDNIKGYRDGVADIVNKIKHQHGRIDIAFGSEDGEALKSNMFAVGYFMTEREDNSKGNNVEVYDFNKIRSINWSVRYHFCLLYVIGEILYECLEKAIYNSWSYKMTYQTADFFINEYTDLFEGIINLPSDVFPNAEILTPKTFVKFSDNELFIQHPIGLIENIQPFGLQTPGEELDNKKIIHIHIPNDTLLNNLRCAQGAIELDINDEILAKDFYLMTINLDKSGLIEVNYSIGVNVRTVTGPKFITQIACRPEELDGTFQVRAYSIEYLGIKIGESLPD